MCSLFQGGNKLHYCGWLPAGTTEAVVAGAAHACQVHVTADIPSFEFSSFQIQHYQAVLINTGWEVRQQQQQQQTTAAAAAGVPSWSEAAQSSSSSMTSSSRSEVVCRLARVPLSSLCPRGFIMIWVNKEHLSGTALSTTSPGAICLWVYVCFAWCVTSACPARHIH